MTTNVLTINQVQRGVPAYDILIDGVDCGVLTHFPNDAKAMATLRLGGVLLTLDGATLGDLMMKLFEMIVPISDDDDEEENIDIDLDGGLSAVNEDAEIEERVYDENDYFNEEEEYAKAMYLKAVSLGYDDPNF